MHPRIGRGVEPGQRLGVEIFQIPKVQARPEISPHIFHPILDFAFRLWSIRLAGLRAEACHIGKVQKAWIPMHDILRITPQHHTFEVIVEQPPGNASQVRKRVQMTADEPGRIR